MKARFLESLAVASLITAVDASAQPAAPAPKELASVIESHLRLTLWRAPRHCAMLGFSPMPQGYRHAFKDTAFDFTPAGFRLLVHPNSAELPEPVLSRLRFFARHGLLLSRTLADDVSEYTMTWKGFAASDQNGCFLAASGAPRVRVLASTAQRRENVQVRQVSAEVSLGAPAEWTKGADFAAAFGSELANALGPKPMVFELVRGERGLTVIAEDGKPVWPTGGYDPALVSVYAKRAGPLDASSLKSRLQAYLDGPGETLARICLPVPSADEADESDFYNTTTTNGAVQAKRSATFKFYNLLDAGDLRREAILRGYEKMRKLESLGLARSEQLPERDFRGAVAKGAVRFILEGSLAEQVLNSPTRCFVAARLAVDAIVSFEPVEPYREFYRFSAKLKLLPAGALGERAVREYGHIARMATVGAGVRASYRVGPDGVRLEMGAMRLPAYAPDVSGTVLPTVTAIDVRAPATPAERLSTEVPVRVTLLQVMEMSRISKDGLTMTYGGAGTHTIARSSVARSRGQWYAEATLKLRPGAQAPDTDTTVGVARNPRQGSDFITGLPRAEAFNMRALAQRVDDGETIGIALDADLGKAYFFRGGNWTTGAPGNPDAGVQIARSTEYVVYAASSASSESDLGRDAWTLNFGASPFKYPIPAGYLSWDARAAGAGVKPAAAATSGIATPFPPGMTHRCRKAGGAIVYLDRPCAQAGMEQVDAVEASRNTPQGRSRSSDRILWIDPKSGGTETIELQPEAPSK